MEELKDDKVKIVGKVLWVLKREDGSEEKGETHNLVVSDGDRYLADRISTTPAMAQMGFMVLGTGGITPTKGLVWVQTGYAGNGKALDATYPKIKAGVLNTVQYVCTFGAGEGTANGINEIIISNVDASGAGGDPGTGDTLSYALLSPIISKGNLDSVVWTWELAILGA